jgi:HAD superfamily hydrolase (TIGR01509 family)
MHSFHHVGLEAGDLFTMERFYRCILGFHLEYRYESANSPGLRTVFLKRGGLRLELLSRPVLPGQGGARPAWGHLALASDDPDREWESARRAARGVGFPTDAWKPPRLTGDGHREAVAIDPEGNAIELVRTERVSGRPAIAAVIFDFDGTLADSEPNYYLAAKALLADYGIDYTETDNARYVGKGNKLMLEDLVARHGLPCTVEELGRRKDAFYLELARRETRAFPAMLRFLDLVGQAGLPAALASGSTRLVLDDLLGRMGLRERFALVLSSEEVPRGKPAPDVFLETARRLALPSQRCLVVEDSGPGTEAAVRAFMPCLSVPSTTEPLDPAFAMADYLVPGGMAAFDPDEAFAWLRGFPSGVEGIP